MVWHHLGLRKEIKNDFKKIECIPKHFFSYMRSKATLYVIVSKEKKNLFF